MTVEEATALVVREGWPDGNAREDAMYMMLHFGFGPDVGDGPITRLIEAINVVNEATVGPVDRQLAGSLWLLGVEANTVLGSGAKWSMAYYDRIQKLLETVEAFFMDEKPIDNLERKGSQA